MPETVRTQIEHEKKPQRVRIRFYFNKNDHETRTPRLENARFTVTSNSGSIESEDTRTLAEGTEMYTIIAAMPVERNIRGWRFDHMLNTSYDADKACAGAGEVSYLE